MVSEIYNHEMSRTAEASCLKCEKLHTSCYSFIRKAILSETEVVSDYARYGCTKYKGPGQNYVIRYSAYETFSTRTMVYDALKTGKRQSLDKLTTTLCLDRQIVLNNISRLRKKGLNVIKEQRRGEVYYQLAQ